MSFNSLSSLPAAARCSLVSDLCGWSSSCGGRSEPTLKGGRRRTLRVKSRVAWKTVCAIQRRTPLRSPDGLKKRKNQNGCSRNQTCRPCYVTHPSSLSKPGAYITHDATCPLPDCWGDSVVSSQWRLTSPQAEITRFGKNLFSLTPPRVLCIFSFFKWSDIAWGGSSDLAPLPLDPRRALQNFSLHFFADTSLHPEVRHETTRGRQTETTSGIKLLFQKNVIELCFWPPVMSQCVTQRGDITVGLGDGQLTREGKETLVLSKVTP